MKEVPWTALPTSARHGEPMADHLRCGRRATLLGASYAATGAVLGCASERSGPVTRDVRDGDEQARGRLSFRPEQHQGPREPPEHPRTGSFAMDAGAGRPAALHVPDVTGPLRLVVVLHGAGGDPRRTRELLLPYAEQHRLLLLAPASARSSWDVIHGGFGPDVATIDELLRRTAAEFAIEGITMAGFSDGASYALTLGVSNGDVVDSVVAFSPGFAAAQVRHGRPRFFVSHGTGDRVLPIDRCSRRLVPALERDGYDVTYEEFDGGHEVPPAVRQQAVTWLDQRSSREP